MTPVKIVILGAGFGGANVALQLDEKISNKIKGNGIFSRIYQWLKCLIFESSESTLIGYDITLISNLPFFHHNIASLRSIVEPAIVPRMLIPLTHIFDNTISASPSNGNSYNGRFIQGKVTDISDTQVTFESSNGNISNNISFDYLVIALGSSYPGCKLKVHTEEACREYFTNINTKLKAAKSVVIIGGGPVGVELAGEISTDFPEKKITLVHAESALINQGGHPKLQKRLENGLKSKGVAVILGERIVDNNVLKDFANFGNKTIITDKGTKLETDAVFKCTGTLPNSEPIASLASIIKSKDNKDIIENNGRIRVNEYLQVIGTKNIFAVGDISNVPELKLGYRATLHASIVADNILSLISENNTTLKKYKPSRMNLISVPLGRNGGQTQFTSAFVLGDWVTRNLKSVDLFMTKYWEILRAGTPQ